MNYYTSIQSFAHCRTIYRSFTLNLSGRGYLEWEGVFGVGGGIWNGRGYLEKNSTAMNENSGVLKNSCDIIYSYEWC